MRRFFSKRIYKTIESREINTNQYRGVVRITAITDPEEYRLHKLNGVKPVKIEQLSYDGTYIVVDRCDNIFTAQTAFEIIVDKLTKSTLHNRPDLLDYILG